MTSDHIRSTVRCCEGIVRERVWIYFIYIYLRLCFFRSVAVVVVACLLGRQLTLLFVVGVAAHEYNHRSKQICAFNERRLDSRLSER